MNEQAIAERITVNPNVMMGKPTIRGLRITVEQILKALAAGIPIPELIEEYPELEAEDFRAIFLFTAELVGETKLYPVAV